MATKKDVDQAYKSGYESGYELGFRNGQARGADQAKAAEDVRIKRVEALTKFVSVAGQSLQTQAEFVKGMSAVMDDMIRGS